MKKLKKTISIIILMTMLLILTNSMEVKAALQANPNTQYIKTNSAENWLNEFRKMETSGGAMGLSETLNSDLTASSDSNNMDVHMMRSTEYGAIAILSASGYGNPSNDMVITSTTGNNTGIIVKTVKSTSDSRWEIVAARQKSTLFSEVNSRYYDEYTASITSAKSGDALGDSTTTYPGCKGWHSAQNGVFEGSYIIRGAGGIFSYNGSTHGYGTANYSRGVVVCGQGL